VLKGHGYRLHIIAEYHLDLGVGGGDRDVAAQYHVYLLFGDAKKSDEDADGVRSCAIEFTYDLDSGKKAGRRMLQRWWGSGRRYALY